jgi:DNA-directed RNA polymerase specialized sigma24 family protein
LKRSIARGCPNSGEPPRRSPALEAWVWRIVVNKARDARRRRPPALARAPHVNLPDLSLDGLTRRQRDIVFLHYYADLDYAEIAVVRVRLSG